jgi:hypothetical protein
MTATTTWTSTARVYLTALGVWLVGVLLWRRKRSRPSFRNEISVRIGARACVGRFEDYLLKQAAFDEYCRSHPGSHDPA